MADTPDWKSRNCMCDDDCAIYGDCCADAKQLNISFSKLAMDKFKCVTLRQFGSNYMVAKCPKDFDDETVRMNCENDLAEVQDQDPLLNIPVTNKKSRLTYRNYFCAICNDDFNEEHLRAWQPRIECPDYLLKTPIEEIKDNIIWNEEKSGWGFEMDGTNGKKWYQCVIDPYIPLDLEFFVRPCHPWISNCTIDDPVLADFCSAYAGYVAVNTQIYRNIHCALCNNETSDAYIACDDYLRLRSSDTWNDFNPIAFSVLFDLNDGDGVGRVGSKCGLGKLYDPFFKKCRRMYCPGKDVVLKDGVCVPKVTDVIFNVSTSVPPFNDYNTSLEFQSCPKFMLSKGDYDLKENNTLFVPVYGKSFDPNEYELVNDTVFICSDWVTEVSKFDPALGWVTLICVIISEICLLIHIIFGFVTPDFKNLSGKNLQSLCLSLFFAFGFFLCAQFVPSYSEYCVIVAVLIHYFFLAAFCWSSVLAFDVYRTLLVATTQLRSPSGKSTKFILYSLWSWLVPLLFVGISSVVEWGDTNFNIAPSYHPHYGKHICWFGQRRALLVYFAAPLAAIMGVNIVLFGWSFVLIRSSALKTQNSVSNTPKREFLLFSRLAILMGLSWVFGLIAGASDWTFLWYFFVIFCALQGLFILVAFTANSRTIRRYFDSMKDTQTGKFNLTNKRTSGTDETDHTNTSSVSASH